MKDFKQAIVIPRSGKNLKGGLEQYGRRIKRGLAGKKVDVAVLCDCFREFSRDIQYLKKIKIIIMCSDIVIGDAVGNDVVQEYNFFKKIGLNVYLYAEKFDEELGKCVVSKKQLEEFFRQSDNIVLYHNANLWDNGEFLIKESLCNNYIKYHNITPYTFFSPYNKELADSCAMGRKQTERLVKSGVFKYYIAASCYNSDELIEYGAPVKNVFVLAPFHKISDFSSAKSNSTIQEELRDGRVNVLFVGRISPNKGHKHLIETVKEYRELYDREIRLNIIGGLEPALNAYYEELVELVREYNLEDLVFFKHRVSFDVLHAYYTSSDIFLVLSEHEGFCVPVLEAQYHRLPVIALDRCAVKRTLGEEQIIFKDIDYKELACAIHIISKDKNIMKYLTDKGYENYLKYETSVLSEKLLNIIRITFKD